MQPLPPEVYTEGGVTELEPVPIVDVSERRTPETVSCMTWQIPQNTTGQPVQILQRRIHRYKAKITIVSVSAAGVQVIFSPKLDTVQGATPQGATYIPATGAADSFLPDWESQKPCYVICVGGTAVVTVQDEAYAG